MPAEVTLLGLDFGTTTSSAVVASAQLAQNSVTGRSDLTDIRESFRSPLVFTPFEDDLINESQLARYLDEWLAAGDVDSEKVFGGGALVTGLAAQRENAPAVVRMIRQRFKNALIATADDPRLEAWLAFMGSCAKLSYACPEVPIVNLDVGGGTTNVAVGQNGIVSRTGCLYVGARHIQVEPGSYQISWLSEYAFDLFAKLNIAKSVGDSLTEVEVQAVVNFQVALINAMIHGNTEFLQHWMAATFVQSPLDLPTDSSDPIVTVTGGVGSLINLHLKAEEWPSTTCYGDLGIDLAKGLIDSLWNDLQTVPPDSAGRATVYGLMQHNTEVSGNTLFLPRPDCLPLTNIPILGTIGLSSTDEYIENLSNMMHASDSGVCVRIELPNQDGDTVRLLSLRLSKMLRATEFPSSQPVVLLVSQNVGKVLGHYVSEWGQLPLNLVVIDEVTVPNAHYLQIGKLHEGVVPVSFYGLHDS